MRQLSQNHFHVAVNPMITIVMITGEEEAITDINLHMTREDVNAPTNVAVDANGKIYVSNYNLNNVTTFRPNGHPTNPTITMGLNDPNAITVTATRIYIPNFFANVATYNLNGKQVAPTINAGLDNPAGVALDATGKIYVTNFSNNTVTTYKPHGQQTSKTITTGLNGPEGIAIH